MTQIISALPSAQTTNAMMQRAHDDAVQTLVDYVRAFRSQIAFRRGIAGASVPSATRRIYVALGGVGGEQAEARYDQFLPVEGTGVFLTRPRVMGMGEWLVIGQASGDELPCA